MIPMPHYTLEELGRYARELRNKAGHSLRVAAKEINREIRSERSDDEDDSGDVHYSNLGKAEKGDSKYTGVLRDALKYYADETFEETPYYKTDLEIDD